MSVTVMNCVLLLYLVACACTGSKGFQTYSLEDAETLFEKFIVDYSKQYADEHEKQMRFEIFKQNLLEINALNEEQGGIEVFGINKFSDYTAEENKQLTGLVTHYSSDYYICDTIKTDADIPDVNAPDSWDWRDHNAVTTVKDQGDCGSCYIFSAVGSIEGQYALKHKELVLLSEQQVVDCGWKITGVDGCWGGVMAPVFMYVMAQGGINTEYDYPYQYKMCNNCSFIPDKIQTKVTDCVSYDLTSHNKLKQLLYANGPISVALDSFVLRKYTKNVIKNCKYRNHIDHAVLLVGYGTDPEEGDYWLFKNSWGSVFGEDGYFRIERGEGKISCGLFNTFMSSPIVA